MIKPTLENYINRYKLDKQLLEKHPENRELLERRIEESKTKILEISNGNKELLN